MKKILILICISLFIGKINAQTDRNGNPVFNSISTSEKKLKNCLFISNYYTLKNNIENKKSSVFISKFPSIAQVEEAAIKIESNFYVLTKKSKIIAMLMLQNVPQKQYTVVLMKSNERLIFPSNLKGDITENRAKELIKQKYDPKAYIENEELSFNGKKLKIILEKFIENEVLDIINKNKLYKKEPSNYTLPSKKEIKSFIISETKKGGKLDFFTEIKGKETDGVQIKPGVFTTRKSIALYKWGRACYTIGVNTVEEAYQIFEELQGKIISRREKDYIKMGFENKWN